MNEAGETLRPELRVPVMLPVMAIGMAGVAFVGAAQSTYTGCCWSPSRSPLAATSSYCGSSLPPSPTLGLTLFQGRMHREIPGLMAMTLISMIPVLITFFIAQRYFIQGIVISGIKG